MTDRAQVFATAALRIATNAFLSWLRGDPIQINDVRDRIAAVAHDEFHDIQRTARDEIRINDDFDY